MLTEKGGKLGQIFIEEGLVKPSDLRISLAGQGGMEYVDLEGLDIPQEILE